MKTRTSPGSAALESHPHRCLERPDEVKRRARAVMDLAWRVLAWSPHPTGRICRGAPQPSKDKVCWFLHSGVAIRCQAMQLLRRRSSTANTRGHAGRTGLRSHRGVHVWEVGTTRGAAETTWHRPASHGVGMSPPMEPSSLASSAQKPPPHRPKTGQNVR